MKYDATKFEVAWRENYELWSAVAWLATGVFDLLLIVLFSALYGFGFHWVGVFGGCALICFAMFWVRRKDASHLQLHQDSITGKALTFIRFPALKKLILGHDGQTPSVTFWLGRGFAWQTKHVQAIQELRKKDMRDTDMNFSDDESDGFSDQSGSEATMGRNWIHGVEPNETDIWVPVKYLEGHSLIVGTTGAGKTRLFDLLISQCVVRGECVIIIDPKGDKEMRENARRACRLLNKEQEFYCFDLAHPKESVLINPLANYSEGTDLASRISALLPTEDAFSAVSWNTVSVIVNGLLLLREKPTLQKIITYVGNDASVLLCEVIQQYAQDNDRYFSTHMNYPITVTDKSNAIRVTGNEVKLAAFSPDERSRLTEIEKKNKGSSWTDEDNKRVSKQEQKLEEITERIRALYWCQYYKKFLEANSPNSAVESLINLYSGDPTWLKKMTGGLVPILMQLTQGEVGELLAPAKAGEMRSSVSLAHVTMAGHVTYVGLNCMANPVVGRAVGSILLADLANVAANRYNHKIEGEVHVPINLFVDECAEVTNVPFVQLLNKARGAGFRILGGTQTIADFEQRLGSQAARDQVLGNFNNIFALRIRDLSTQEYIANQILETRTHYVMHTQGNSTDSSNPLLSTANTGERLMEEETPMLSPQLLGMLPSLEYFAYIAGGTLLKCRVPILTEKETTAQKAKQRSKSKTEKLLSRIAFLPNSDEEVA